MGKLFDYCMTGDWEETQRIAFYKKLGKNMDKLSTKQLKKIQKIIDE